MAEQQLDPQQALAMQFQEVLGISAEQDMNIANARSEATMTEVGAVPQGARVVATFGRTRVDADKISTPDLQAPASRPIDAAKIATDIAKGMPSFDIDSEFFKLRGIADLSEKEQAAQLLFMNIGQKATDIQKQIKIEAMQRAGVNDAQSALDKNLALDTAAVAMGRIRPGDTTIQTENARKAFQTALTAANALETDLLKSNPSMQKFNDYRELLKREFQGIDRAQLKQDDKESRIPYVLTDTRLQNAKLALGIQENDSVKLKNLVASAALKDKALNAVIDADKNSFSGLLANEDPAVRRYAFNIIKGHERAALRLDPDAPDPGYIKGLEKLVGSREAFLTPEATKRIEKQLLTVVGAKEKQAARTQLIQKEIDFQIESTMAAKYQRMDSWQFVDPQFKQVMQNVSSSAPNGQILMSDGIDAIMNADIKNRDGTLMSPTEKIKKMTESLAITMDNDKGSVILPDAANYKAPLATELRNRAWQVHLRNTALKSGQVPLLYLNEASSVPARIFGTISEGAEEIGKRLPAMPSFISEAAAADVVPGAPIRNAQTFEQVAEANNRVMGFTPAMTQMTVESARDLHTDYVKAFRRGFRMPDGRKLGMGEIVEWGKKAKEAELFLEFNGLKPRD